MTGDGRNLDTLLDTLDDYVTDVLDAGARCDDLLSQLLAASEIVGQCHEVFMWIPEDGTQDAYARLDRARAYRDKALIRYRLAAGHATLPAAQEPAR